MRQSPFLIAGIFHLVAVLHQCRGLMYSIGIRVITNRTGRRVCRRLYADSNDINNYHVPVMKNECLEYLNINDGKVFVDCTMGGGGHAKAILDSGGLVVGIDQDPDAITQVTEQLGDYIKEGRLEIIQSNFRNIENSLKGSKIATSGMVHGVLMDLGVSSFQINEPSRGFSFGASGPLNMRMDRMGTASLLGTANIFVNNNATLGTAG